MFLPQQVARGANSPHLVALLSLGVWLELIAVQHGFCSKGTGNWKGWGATFYKADDIEASHLMANHILLVRTYMQSVYVKKYKLT